MVSVGVLFRQGGARLGSPRFLLPSRGALLTTTGNSRPRLDAATVEVQIGAMQRQLRDEMSRHDFDAAIETCRELRSYTEDAYGEDVPNPIQAATFNNLGLAWKGKGDFEEAARQLARATQEYERCGLANHPNTATALHNLGLCYKEHAQQASALSRDSLLESATSCLREALSRRADIAAAAAARGGKTKTTTTHVQSEDEESSSSSPTASNQSAAVPPPGHNDDDRAAASTRVVLASVLRLQKKNDDANREIVDAIGVLRNEYAKKDLNKNATKDAATALATALNNLGFFQKQDQHYDAACANYDEALHLRTTYLGDAHPQTIATLYNIAELYAATGQHDKADEMRRDILKRLEAA
mmetsp:Transcript_38288/g.122778  ORF Transcript_38288/g.122778 Transcript_38288/m.122778 type:complete len:357 (+) Transcript_38288:26-1096(+)